MQATITNNFSGGVTGVPAGTSSGSYVKTTVKKLYPNGDYYLEVTYPYYNTITNGVEYATTKEFITKFDVEECGCLSNTEENKSKVKNYCQDVYDCYYVGGSASCNPSMGGYNIFPETGLIQLNHRFNKDKVYLEYTGFLQKRNGQYVVPEVAFEAVVEGTKFKAVKNKSNIPMNRILWYENNFDKAVADMTKVMGRVSLETIINAVTRVPKFDITFDYYNDCCSPTSEPYNTQLNSSVSDNYCQSTGTACTVGTKHLTPFQIAVTAGTGEGTPEIDSYTYYHPSLVGAADINFIIVDNQPENSINNFTFNSETGVITRQNQWSEGNVLIIPYAKLV